MTAIWKAGTTTEQTYPTLQEDLEVDDVIIGAGITGLTTALKLIDAGRRVAVVEAAKIADSSTGNSTGNLYCTLSAGLVEVKEKWDDNSIRTIVTMRNDAITLIEGTASRFSIKCDYKRVALHRCITDNDKNGLKKLQSECKISAMAGMQAQLVNELPNLPISVTSALRIENQAQFNPFTFTQGLANAIKKLGGLIFEESRVTQIQPKEHFIRTAQGQIRAENIIQATHTPKGINLLQAEMEVFREYGVAAPLSDSECPNGIYWFVNDSQSVRSYSRDGEKFVIVVGGKHKTGKGSTGVNYYNQVEDYLSRHFTGALSSYKWSAQQYKPADLLPYIGRSGHDNVFVATGFSADGLVWGAVAADIISHQILEKDHPGTALLNPRRFTPAESIKNWAKENTSVATELFKTFLTPGKKSELTAIAPGKGKIMTVGGEKLAIYHSPARGLLALSSLCPHMKCRVTWNQDDCSWDCPCHGSRFTVDGEVIEGPACEPLRVHVFEEK